MKRAQPFTLLSASRAVLLTTPTLVLFAQVASAGGAVTIGDMPTDETRPQLACAKPYTDDRPCVMVHEYMHPSVDPDLRSERITVAGVADTSMTTSPSTLKDPETRPTIASMYDSETYLSVWEHRPPSGATQLRSRLLDNDALPKNGAWTTTLVSSGKNASRPAVACALGECMLVWEHEHSASDIDIYGLRVALDGTPIDSPFPIAVSGRNERMPAIDAHVTEGDAAFYVVWQVEDSGQHDIFASFVTGGAPGGRQAIASDPRDETHPTIACRFGQTCMVVFEFEYSPSDHDILAVVLGNLPEDPHTPTLPTIQSQMIAWSALDERGPSIDRDAIYDDKYTLVWEREVDSDTSIISVGRRTYDDGAFASEDSLPTTQGSSDDPRLPVIAGSEWGRYLVAWQERGVNASLDILATPLVFP